MHLAKFSILNWKNLPGDVKIRGEQQNSNLQPIEDKSAALPLSYLITT